MNILEKSIRAIGGVFNERLLAYFKNYGATSNVLQDAEKEYLRGKGLTFGANQDAWKQLDGQYEDIIPLEVSDILKKYNATMLLPGVSGAMRFGYQPGNYRESTGQTLACADQQVGLVVDAAGVPGPELVTGDSSTFDTGVGSWAKTGAALLSASGGIASVTNGVNYSDKAELVISGSSGKTLVVEVDVWVSSGTARVSLRQAASPFAEVAFVLVSNTARTRLRLVGLSPSGNLNIQIVPWSGSAGQFVYFDTVSVREILGIHASQSTSGFQPVLRNTAGIQSWQFDGTDDRLSLSAVPFQMADDHFVVAGGNVTSLGAVTTLATPASKIGSNTRVPQLRVEADGKVRSFWIDGAGASAAVISSGVLVVAGQPFVATARKSGTTGVVRFNGTQQASSSLSALGATACDRGEIGTWAGTDLMNGHIHGVIFGKGAISDSELLTLERFMASLQGRTL